MTELEQLIEIYRSKAVQSVLTKLIYKHGRTIPQREASMAAFLEEDNAKNALIAFVKSEDLQAANDSELDGLGFLRHAIKYGGELSAYRGEIESILNELDKLRKETHA